MTKLKTISTILLGTAFGALTLGYSFFQSFQKDAVYGGIPKHATSTFKTSNLSELYQSPVCSQIDKALGAGNSLEELLTASSWTKLAAPSEIALANISSRNMNGQKTWAATSWVGWRSPWLRWKLQQSRNKNLHFLGKYSVWPIWKYDAPDIAKGMSLTISLTDNLLLICLSERPSDITLLLEAYDNQTQSSKRKKG